MNKIKYLLTVIAVCFYSNAFSKVFDAEEFYLDNNLRVVVVENHKAPIVKMMLWYQVGSMDEKAGKSGLAHLLEHLMFRGTSRVPASSFNEMMLENGADFNAFTNQDFTVYHALVDVSRLELVMALEADRMKNLKIDDNAFSGEQKIVYQEREERIENNPKSRFSEEAHQILWQGTPYAHPVSGTLEEINALTKKDAIDFYLRFYAPNNAVLVLSGDIDLNEAKILAQKYFGNIPSVNENNRKSLTFEIENTGSYGISKEMADIESSRASISFVVPSVLENKKAAYAMLVFSNYFGESANSYLNKVLVQKNKVIQASSSADVFSRGPGLFSVSALLLNNQNTSSDIQMLKKTIKEGMDSLTPNMLEKEKKKILSWFVYVKDNPSDAAFIVGELASLGLELDEIESYAQNIEAVTHKDIVDAVTHMLNSSKNITALLMPAEEEK